MFICAVTLNWNRSHDTIVCLNSLSKQSFENLHLVVVDNGSSDNSVEEIRKAFPDVDLLENSENQGFAAGMNMGIRYALSLGADAVFVLNNDTFLAEDTVAHLASICTDEVGLVMPLIYFAHLENVVWSAGGTVHPWTLEVVDDSRGVKDIGQFSEVRELDFAPGCGMLLCRNALEDVGGFDECFFMYYEDSDLCRRLRMAGYKILLAPKAKMWHKVASSSGGADSPNERYWMARSSVRFYLKNAAWYQLPVIFMWRLGSALRTTIRLLKHGRYAALNTYWEGLITGLLHVLTHKCDHETNIDAIL